MAVRKIDPFYTASVTVTGARNGRAVSSDGALDIELKTPGGNATNPEQLFAAAYGACYQGAVIGRAREAGLDAAGSTVVVEVSVGKAEDGVSGLAVKLTVTIPGVDREQAQAIAEAAHETCPYSLAVRDSVEVEVVIAE